MPKPSLPIFYDPQGHRRRRLRGLAGVLGTAGLLTVVGMGVALWQPDALPTLHLPEHVGEARPWIGVEQAARVSARTGLDQMASWQRAQWSSLRPARSDTQIAAVQAPRRVTGFFVAWDDNSFGSLRRNIASLDTVVPEYWHLAAGGQLQAESPAKNAAMLAFVAARRPGLRVMPMVNNYDPKTQDWASGRLETVLGDVTQRRALVGRLVSGVRDGRFAGLNVDFENLSATTQPSYLKFIAELAAPLHAAGKTLTLDAPLDDPEFPYKALGKLADSVVLMAYDEHEEHSAPGPVASQGWLIRSVQARLREIPARKLSAALGNYGYDWTAGAPNASDVTVQEALATARDAGVKPHLDAGSLNPTFRYQGEDGKAHTVWYLDGVSAYNQARSLSALGISNLAMWRLGSEDPDIWPALKLKPVAAQAALSSLHSGYDIDYRGHGELLKISGAPQMGQRRLSIDAASGLITAEAITRFASPYVIQRWGGNDPKKIALTFDDGPDPVYTPQILDILKRANVPGTFFVVGLEAQSQPELLRRMAAQGDEIGTHTFTHPNLALVSRTQFDLELSATQRLIEGQVGLRTLLFRPPFAEDVEPTTPDEAGLVARASQLGYYTVGMQIDPGDWEQPGVDRIVSRVLNQVQSGNVILLHDAGGDRAQTVSALPRIISLLRGKGYTFTTVSKLAGLKTSDVNPPISGAERLGARLMGLNFAALAGLGSLMGLLFKVGIVLSIGRLAIITALALREEVRRRGAARVSSAAFAALPTVAVIVPAYNEGKVIVGALRSLLASDLPGLRVYVVDDGSTDDTAVVVRSAYAEHPQVTIFSVPNGGKALALNYALERVDAEVVVLLDADTHINVQAARLLAGHFLDPAVAAVAGNAKVGNRVNLLTRWQALEYITAQNLERRAMSQLNAISVVPGAIGAWRRSVLLSLGGFDHDTLAEDADLTMRALRAGYRVTYELGAVARTEAPDTLRSFLRQRDRWMFGTLQATWKQRGAWRSVPGSRPSGLGLFTLPNVLLFQVALPLIGALLDLSFVLSLGWSLLQFHYHPDGGFVFSGPALGFYGLFMLIDLLAAAAAFILEPGEDWRLLPLLLPQRLVYRQLMSYVAIRAVLGAVQGQQRGWGTQVRKASVGAACI